MTLQPRSLAVLALASLALAPAAPPATACTTAVVSREASATGRAMLWKNRDADGSDNQVVFLSDGKYPYVGLVNRGDTMGLQIWAGVNTAGFAIMNSASYNLESGDTVGEGTLMKLALQTCASVEDFEALLAKSNSGGRDVSANFGVVDAKGGAATFETGKKGYVRFDAAATNDGAKGLLVRSNYSRSGGKELGSGFLREARGIELLGPLAASGKLDARAILRTAARDVTNAAIGSTGAETGPPLVYTADSVCRLDTVSAVVLEAPAAGEGPEAAAMWVVPSLPVTGVGRAGLPCGRSGAGSPLGPEGCSAPRRRFPGPPRPALPRDPWREEALHGPGGPRTRPGGGAAAPPRRRGRDVPLRRSRACGLAEAPPPPPRR